MENGDVRVNMNKTSYDKWRQPTATQNLMTLASAIPGIFKGVKILKLEEAGKG